MNLVTINIYVHSIFWADRFFILHLSVLLFLDLILYFYFVTSITYFYLFLLGPYSAPNLTIKTSYISGLWFKYAKWLPK